MTLWTDTNYKQFKSNLVLRWECKPGSILFIVCSQEKTGNNSNGEFSFKENLKDMFNLIAFDVVLLKLSYRFVK